MKKLLVVLVVLVAFATGAFAQDMFASYNKPGNVNIYASAGWYGFPEVTVGLEYMIGEFNIGPVPLDWGIQARAGLEFYGFDFTAGAMASLHMGLIWNLEIYAALGVCYNSWTTFPLDVASYNGITYWVSKNLGVLVETGYLGWYFWGVGVEFKL